jgi:CMP-N-acetylneuraminic acid synthetase
LIVARKGSCRLPGKNRLELAGKPLYAWTIGAALESGVFADILVSTDDPEILQGARDLGVRTHERPKELADSETSVPQVIVKMAEQDILDARHDGICLLSPCHPFRSAGHIREATAVFDRTSADSLVTISEYPCPVGLGLRLEEGYLSTPPGLVRKAEHEASYYPNGAIVCLDRERFLEHQAIYTDQTVGSILPWPFSLDIDTAKDLELAQLLAPCLFRAPGG